MRKVVSLLAKLQITGAAESRAGLKGVGDEAKRTGDSAKKAGSDIDSGLTGPFKRVQSAGRATVGVLQRVGSVGKEVLGVFGRISGVAASGAGLVAGLGGNAAVQASLAYSNLSARLEAVTGNADKAARKLQYAQAVANPSNFSFSELANASTILQAFGINAERALPTVARLGMAFGADGEQLAVLVRGLGDISAGKFLESDTAASFGLNRSLFESKNIKFDGQGQLLSSATETFEALEQIVNEKYGGIFDKIGNTPGAKLASLGDSWEKLERIIGDGILKVAAPGIERLTRLINGLGDSGVALDAVTAAADGMTRLLGGMGGGDLMTRFVAGALSVAAALPDAAHETGSYLVNAFKVVGANVKTVFDYVGEKTSALISGIYTVLTAFGHFGLDIATKVGEAVGLLDKKMKSDMPSLQSLPDMPKFNLLGKQDEYYGKLMMAMQKPVDNSVPEARGNGLENAMQKRRDEEDTLSEIAYNTKKSADFLSLRAQATGTGASNIIGPTAAELQGGAAGTRRVVVETAGFETELSRLIKKMAVQIINGGVGSGFTERAF